MTHNQFFIGCEFFTSNDPMFRFRVTDIGIRTIIAIKISRSDLTWHHGPPYPVEEIVFDEYDISSCYISEKTDMTSENDTPIDLGEIKSEELPDMLESLGKHRSLVTTERNTCRYAADELRRLYTMEKTVTVVRHSCDDANNATMNLGADEDSQ